MIKINDLVEQIGVQRKIVFVSLNHESKKISEKLVAELDKLFIPNWCMYDGKGNNTNKGGDNYKTVISENIKKTCLFVSLVSKEYIKSPEVAEEVYLVLKEVEDCTRPNIVFFPIFVDDTTNEEFTNFIKGVLETYKDELGERSKKVAEPLMKHNIVHNTLDSEMTGVDAICEQLKEQYVKSVTRNAQRRISLIKNANIFTDLLNLCIKQSCESNSVSEDIKKSQEIGSLEVHVISNEMLDYDLNTYSLVVISSNLLGSPLDVEPYFKPSKNGTKYFYYLTKEYESNFKTLHEQLHSFLKKDLDSRMKVSGLIRRDFCFRNRVIFYFKEAFGGKSVDELANQFRIDSAVNEIEDLFNDDASRVFVGTFDEKVFVPESIISWFRGYRLSMEEVTAFVEFIKRFYQIVNAHRDGASETNIALLRKYLKYLEALRRFENWQLGKIPSMTKNESRQLVRDLLNTNMSSFPNKQYPLIEDWLQFVYDKDGNVQEISDEVVEEALDNCSCIVVDDYSGDYKLIKLAYSFFITIDSEGILTGAWYTTGSRFDMIKAFIAQNSGENKEKNNDDMFTLVTTYNITSQSDQCYTKLLEALAYLIEVSNNARKVLNKKKSRIMNYVSNYAIGDK